MPSVLAKVRGDGQAAQTGPESNRPRRMGLVLLITVAAVHVALSAHAAFVETPTIDEYAHLPAGCAYLRLGRLDVYAKNPPLARYWMALPVAADPATNVPAPRAVLDQAW